MPHLMIVVFVDIGKILLYGHKSCGILHHAGKEVLLLSSKFRVARWGVLLVLDEDTLVFRAL